MTPLLLLLGVLTESRTPVGPPAPDGWLGPNLLEYDDACPNLGNGGMVSVERCTQLCDAFEGCDAVNFVFNKGQEKGNCVFRGCDAAHTKPKGRWPDTISYLRNAPAPPAPPTWDIGPSCLPCLVHPTTWVTAPLLVLWAGSLVGGCRLPRCLAVYSACRDTLR